LHIFSSVIRHEARKHGKEFPCDQTPQNVFYIPEILDAFPDSYFIIWSATRVMSCCRKKESGNAGSWVEQACYLVRNHPCMDELSPITISKLWNAAVRAREKVNDKRVMSVPFESLLQDPDKSIEAICNFIGISFSPVLKEVPQVVVPAGWTKKR
jgi:hypothetical protein